MNTVSQLKDSLSGILSGLDLNSVTDLNGAIERGARITVQKAGIPEASGTQNISLYNGVYDYLCDTKIFGGAITDVAPQGVSRRWDDDVQKTYPDNFDRMKQWLHDGTLVTFRYNKGTPIIRIVTNRTTPKIILDSMNDTTGWTASGNASGLAVDRTVYYESPASLRFNLVTAGSQGLLTKTLTSPIDLTSYNGVGVVFLAAYLPTGTDFTSLRLRIGNDASNYYEVSATIAFLGAFPNSEFALIPFDLSTATTTGSVTITAMDYIQLAFNYNGTAQANVRVGSLFIALPSPNTISFRSAAIFLVGSTVSSAITTDADFVLLNESAYTIFQHEAALSVLIQTGGTLASPVYQMLNDILDGNPQKQKLGLYQLYRGDNPSQELRTVGSWY